MAATSVFTRKEDDGYKRWIKVNEGLLEMKAALGPIITEVIQQLHADVKAKVAKLPPCTTCTTRDIDKRTGTFTTGCKTHNTMVAEILTHHTAGRHPKSVYWPNTDASQWFTDGWTIAKLFMGRGILAKNTGVADTDVNNLLILMTNCKDFKSTRVVQNERLLWTVLTVRNEIMHSPGMSLDEDAMKDDIGHMIALLQHPGLVARPTCVQGVTNLNQIKDTDITPKYELDIMKQGIDALSASLDAELDAINTRVDALDQRQDAADQSLHAFDQNLDEVVKDRLKEVEYQSTEHEQRIRALEEETSTLVAFMNQNPDLRMKLQGDQNPDLRMKLQGGFDLLKKQWKVAQNRQTEEQAADISDVKRQAEEHTYRNKTKDSKVIGGDTNASSSYVDGKGPQLENEKEDSIKRAMYCIIDAARSIKGLHIRRYSRRPNELEVIAAVDEGLSLVDMERQLQHIAGEDLRVKLTIGSFPKFKFTCGSLGSGDIVDVAHVEGRTAAACIMGYVSNNNTNVYALTVGHVFASAENFPSECRIVTRDKVKVTGTVTLSVLKTSYMPERYGAVHDLALIEINNPIVASNTLTVDGYDYHPRIYREDANLVNKDVRLWRPTNGNNATTARVASQDHAEDGTFLYYELECEAGGAVSVQGDSGTLVCSIPQPNVGNVPVVDAYAYIFASTDEHSFALPIMPQLQDLLAGSQMNYRNFNFFRNFKIDTVPTLTYR